MFFPFLHFEFFAIFSYCLHFATFFMLVKETAEIETGMAEKSSCMEPGKHTAKTRFGLEKYKEN
jgi:hypothetical protein